MANYVADVEALDAESQRCIPGVPVGTRVIIVTCMDCRIDVWSTFGLQPRQAHVLRNAGGRPQDALRSILLSLHVVAPGSSEIWVVQHTGCGMMSRNPDRPLTDEALRESLLDAPALKDHKKEIEERVNNINFLPITSRTLEDSVRGDMEWLREPKQQPLIPANTVLRGFVYHVATETTKPHLEEVKEAGFRPFLENV